jgi:hypothetical protein
MARKYINPNRPALVADEALEEARQRAQAAAERLHTVEQADPLAPVWDGEYEAATIAARVAQRRLEALESLRARQVERSGQRAAAVKKAGLYGIATALAASRDQVSAASRQHLASAASLASAVDEHNRQLAQHRAHLAELGLAVVDDLLDEGQQHDEGTVDGGGLRAGGTTWTPVPPPGVALHALLLVFDGPGGFQGPFAFMRAWWPAHMLTSRPDGLAIPLEIGGGNGSRSA